MTSREVSGPQFDHLLDAILMVGSELRLPVVLRRIAEAATALADASYGALGVLDETGTSLAEFIPVGLDDETVERIGELPKGHGILGLLIVEPAPIRLPNIHEHPDSFGLPPGHPPMTSFLGVPIRVRGQVFGNLYLTDKRNGGEFTDADETLVVALAAVAGVAIENARLHSRVADLVLVEDRERIARDLHDTVIQRIFATGLALQGLAARIDDRELASRLASTVDDLDDTVRHIRTTIFELQQPRLPGRSLRRELLDLAAEAAGSLGSSIATSFDGPVDTEVDDALADQVLAVVREALSNVVRHSGAHRSELTVAVRAGRIRVEVVDDGVGLPEQIRDGAQGLANLRTRAERCGGSCTVESTTGGGTQVVWTAPLG